MVLVVGFHAALLLLLTHGFGLLPAKEAPPPPFHGTFIDEPPIDDQPLPPIAAPTLSTLSIPIEPPDELTFEQDPPPTVLLGEPPRVDGETGGSAVPQPVVQGVRLDARHPLSEPYYSPEVIRAGGQGALQLQIYVLPNGRVGDARILKSSGFESLDRAAIQEAKRNWRLLPATRDGEPFAQWYSLRVVFKLDKQR
ncbi:MAG TPA: TonB family protein [Steroidobacteraceae bacterium]|nr:TonB family protein [Steroidobacteraceae bacterium]